MVGQRFIGARLSLSNLGVAVAEQHVAHLMNNDDFICLVSQGQRETIDSCLCCRLLFRCLSGEEAARLTCPQFGIETASGDQFVM